MFANTKILSNKYNLLFKGFSVFSYYPTWLCR